MWKLYNRTITFSRIFLYSSLAKIHRGRKTIIVWKFYYTFSIPCVKTLNFWTQTEIGRKSMPGATQAMTSDIWPLTRINRRPSENLRSLKFTVLEVRKNGQLTSEQLNLKTYPSEFTLPGYYPDVSCPEFLDRYYSLLVGCRIPLQM